MARVKVLCAGDSMTLGSTAFRGSYRRHLGNMCPNLHFVGSQRDHLGNDGYGYHEGYSGGTIAVRGATQLTAIDTYGAEIVLIWYGTNEVSTDTEDVTELYTFATDCLAKSTVHTVIVGNCNKRRSDDSKYAQQNTYRADIATHFTVTQAPLPSGLYYCDPAVDIDDSHFGDSVHLNDAGYQLCSYVWKTALASAGAQLYQNERGSDNGDFL